MTMSPDPSLAAFRQRLRGLITDRYEGKYTALARAAGIPVSSMEHIMRTARRLPGGGQLVRLATTLDVSIDELVTGTAIGPRTP